MQNEFSPFNDFTMLHIYVALSGHGAEYCEICHIPSVISTNCAEMACHTIAFTTSSHETNYLSFTKTHNIYSYCHVLRRSYEVFMDLYQE